MILRLYLTVFWVLLWFAFIGFWQAALLQMIVGMLIFVRHTALT
jgi:hypothetical protein